VDRSPPAHEPWATSHFPPRQSRFRCWLAGMGATPAKARMRQLNQPCTSVAKAASICESNQTAETALSSTPHYQRRTQAKMRYRLSGSVILLLHFFVMTPISVAFGRIDGGTWLPPVLYVAGALSMWIFSLPGAKRRLISDTWSYFHQAKMFNQHGFRNMGHARRRDWDRHGRTSRVFVHVMGLIVTVISMSWTEAGSDLFWQSLFLGASFAIGNEAGFLFFKSGDTPDGRNQQRPK
jgi:hypothetical protein